MIRERQERPGGSRYLGSGTKREGGLGQSAVSVLDSGPSSAQAGKQEDIRKMFGWRSKEAELEEARYRQAFRKRLSEVLGLPDEDAAPSEATPQARFETALETNAGTQLSRTC